jgi:DNA-binding transcriptional MerR regulator
MVPTKQKQGSGELVTQTEAAKMLGVPPRAILRLMERGILEPAKTRGKTRWFALRDVSAASDALEQKLSFSSILEKSTQAHTAASRVERKLNALLEFFGIDVLQPIPTQEQIEANELKGYDLIAKGATGMKPADIMHWAKAMMRVDDAYLRLASYYSRKADTWNALVAGTNALLRGVTIEMLRESPDMAMAVSLLSYARKNLIAEAYGYCRYTMGKKLADIEFPDMMRGEVNDVIATLIRS